MNMSEICYYCDEDYEKTGKLCDYKNCEDYKEFLREQEKNSITACLNGDSEYF